MKKGIKRKNLSLISTAGRQGSLNGAVPSIDRDPKKKEPLQEHPVFREARICLQTGYFEGVLNRTSQLAISYSGSRNSRLHLEWLARVYLGGAKSPSHRLTLDVRPLFSALSGGQGVTELCLVTLQSNPINAEKIIHELVGYIFQQKGVIVTWHPTALLRLARFAQKNFEDPALARHLVNLALGFQAYWVLSDLELLADLLINLEAPTALWADWCSKFLQHLLLARKRLAFFEENFQDQIAVQWAYEQENASKDLLGQVIATGPPELIPLLVKLSPHMGVPSFAEVVVNLFQTPKRSTEITPPHSSWSDLDAIRLRYFWHQVVTKPVQDLVRNGDWAIFHIPTGDFSMSVAQWWRALETILKTTIAEELSKLFTEHPEWAEWDRRNLSSKEQKRESVFLEKLPDPQKTAHLTLGDLVLVLKKCIPVDGATPKVKSKLRLEAIRFFNTYRGQFRPMVQSEWIFPPHLTNENVNWFRNKASHDGPMDFIDAAVGRLVARRVFDVFFLPVLKADGFSVSWPTGVVQ